MLFREKKREGEKERIRSKIIQIIEKANTKGNRNDNLTEKERKFKRQKKHCNPTGRQRRGHCSDEQKMV